MAEEPTKETETKQTEITQENKEEDNISKIDKKLEFENMDLDNLLTLGLNFDMLKEIINNIIKNQHKINFQLAELKLDKINKEKRTDELETMIIDLKILKEDSNQIKKDLQEQKKKLLSKEYQKEIALILKEKGYFLESIDNLNKSKINKNNLMTFNNKDRINRNDDSNYLNEIKNELMLYNDIFKNEINSEMNKIKSKFEEVKSKMICNEKDFILMKKTIKNTEEKMDIKFTQDMPKLIEKIFYSKITNIDSKVMQMNDEFENNLNKYKEIIKKNVNELQKNIQTKNEELDKQIEELKKNSKNLSEKINLLSNEKLKEYLKLKDYKEYQLEIEGKIMYENKQVSLEVSKLNNILTSLKNEFNDYVSDKTDHNNLVSLIKRFEYISAIAFKTQEAQEEFEKEKKRLQLFDPKKFVASDLYDDFKSNTLKLFSSIQKDFQDVKSELMEINAKSLGTKASIRDLKTLEDNLLLKIDELFNIIKEKFAEKNMVLKNNKIIELKMKQIIEDYKKNEKNDTWLLSKKPIGHLCASCEAYLGDLKDSSTNTKYIPWNKYPTKDPMDKLYRVGAGFSKMLKMITPDSQRNKTKSSSLNEILTSKKDIEEETNSNITKDKIMINNSINLENNSGIQMDNEINSIKYKLPNLIKTNNLKKNLTFTNFYSNDTNEEINSKSNTGIHFNNIIVNNINKNKKMKTNNIDIDKDEIIHLPNSPHLIKKIFSYEDQKSPKIMKIYKKISNNNKDRKIISIKDKIIN